MLNKIKRSFINLRHVFLKIKYVILALVFGALFYLLNLFISTSGNILSFYRTQGLSKIISFTFNLFVNFRSTILLSSFIMIIVLSFLTGILFSLIFYKINLRGKILYENGFLASIGMFLGIFAPGCAACGLGLAAFFGLAASFATLPFKGLEISVLAGIIMIVSILKFSYTLSDDACQINFNNQKIERRLQKKWEMKVVNLKLLL